LAWLPGWLDRVVNRIAALLLGEPWWECPHCGRHFGRHEAYIPMQAWRRLSGFKRVCSLQCAQDATVGEIEIENEDH
jgi:hypothetical protein